MEKNPRDTLENPTSMFLNLLEEFQEKTPKAISKANYGRTLGGILEKIQKGTPCDTSGGLPRRMSCGISEGIVPAFLQEFIQCIYSLLLLLL